MKQLTITNPTEWDATVSSLPAAHVLQSWAWGEFKSRWGWQPQRLLWQVDNQPVAAAQILQRPLPATPWNFLYVSKGPALDYRNPARVAQILTSLEDYARQVGALFLKIDPDLPLQTDETPCPSGHIVRHLLQRRGWQLSNEQIQFRNTVIINLHPPEEELLAAMKSKWRYNIRLAKRRGVIVRQGSMADLGQFYQMYAETAQRDQFLIRPQGYYRDLWAEFIGTNQAELLLAEVNDTVVAGLLLFFFGERSWYLYGASTDQHRKDMPNHLLQWEAIRRSKARGCTHYDMWGAPNQFTETDPMWGVYRFKQGFAGQTIHGLGAWDFPAKPWLYHGFTELLPRARQFIRRLRS